MRIWSFRSALVKTGNGMEQASTDARRRNLPSADRLKVGSGISKEKGHPDGCPFSLEAPPGLESPPGTKRFALSPESAFGRPIQGWE